MLWVLARGRETRDLRTNMYGAANRFRGPLFLSQAPVPSVGLVPKCSCRDCSVTGLRSLSVQRGQQHCALG
eukprot:5456924-Pyramimonas_sp.AAC.1